MAGLGALRFALTQARAPHAEGPASADRVVKLETAYGPLAVWVYRPSRHPRGALVTIPGLSPKGVADPRWVKVNHGLRRAGFTVLAPDFPDIAALRMGPAQVDQIEAALLAILSRPDLHNGLQVSIFSVSFSGSLSLLACTRPALRGRVRAVFALGTFCSIGAALERVMVDPAADPYGRLILMGNFLEASVGPRPHLRQACFTLALQHWHREPEAALQQTVQGLGDDDRRLLRALLDDPALRQRHWDRMRSAHAHTLQAMDVVPRLSPALPPVTLVHGLGDDVIPESESEALAVAIRSAGGQVRLLLTSMVQHGTAKPLWAQLVGLPLFLRTFEGFLADAST